jgi:hypothetical protein
MLTGNSVTCVVPLNTFFRVLRQPASTRTFRGGYHSQVHGDSDGCIMEPHSAQRATRRAVRSARASKSVNAVTAEIEMSSGWQVTRGTGFVKNFPEVIGVDLAFYVGKLRAVNISTMERECCCRNTLTYWQCVLTS